MNVGTIMCLIFILFFSIVFLIFTLLKNKSAMLVSGFNTMSKTKREEYDFHLIVKDMKKSMLSYILIFILGALLSYFINEFFSILALTIWIIVVLKEVHLDPKKAFEKYLIKK